MSGGWIRQLIQAPEADAILHCGDLCFPFVVKRLGEGIASQPVDIARGNNEGDVRLICQIASQCPQATLQGEFAGLKMDGLSIAFNHFPAVARALAKSEAYDLVCYGLDHTRHQETVGHCLLLKPGGGTRIAHRAQLRLV